MASKRKSYVVKTTLGKDTKINPYPMTGTGKGKKIVLIAIAILGAVIFLRIVLFIAGKGKKGPEDAERVPVDAVMAKVQNIRDMVYLTERLEALSDVNVYPPAPGNINAVNVDIGARVGKNQIVATVDRNLVG
jgi:multidrug efflux pump subunit AcrA (membrane-fusion protein)